MDFFFVIWIGGVFALFIYRMVKHIRNATKLRNEGLKALGTVVGFKTRWGRTTTVHPRIQFITQIGEVVEVEGHTGIAIPLQRKGEKVTIYYEADNPKNFALDSEFERSSPYLMIILIVIMVAIFIGYYVTQ
ncbi:DUF3592 domain-containing protein [Hymenobacter sp. BT188]|uniref:DUF3592 domain-containing protein n=1 Tax=Hymenobacter sp. BT188 TaxID=2763504 RepID=UPI0016517EC4|nr:DUF3592 domain-containing protein [Hymenobacter sp. BT188]MBC6605912.1 DUF3592 domain-containing protein [Hymenobacter sp. BT188]